ncbi:hypothetical protein ABW19_dt0206023 [Dactylella cylindrospora]|nr:hypothetical protein ABW19_dt0206023 [Dactylella cylindrospora]
MSTTPKSPSQNNAPNTGDLESVEQPARKAIPDTKESKQPKPTPTTQSTRYNLRNRATTGSSKSGNRPEGNMGGEAEPLPAASKAKRKRTNENEEEGTQPRKKKSIKVITKGARKSATAVRLPSLPRPQPEQRFTTQLNLISAELGPEEAHRLAEERLVEICAPKRGHEEWILNNRFFKINTEHPETLLRGLERLAAIEQYRENARRAKLGFMPVFDTSETEGARLRNRLCRLPEQSGRLEWRT